MRRYRYNFLDQNRIAEATLVLYAASDEAACDLASDLLSRSEALFVEVRSGSRLIFQIGRSAADSNRPAVPLQAAS